MSTVYLVGAGPGDPGLMTVRGLRLLRKADVIVYDRLVNPELLAEASPNALLIFVGKHAGRPCSSQEEINATLIHYGRQGLCVVRLKGGDPFVFGRGGEEAEALVEAGIPFEIVPGVSSAVAVPAYAGIPVTHRGVASSFAVVTGHRQNGSEHAEIDWESLAKSVDTLVVLMGLHTLPNVISKLLASGRPAETPVALIRSGTTAEQQTVIGTLGDIIAKAREAVLEPPVLTVIGNVVNLGEKLQWFAAVGDQESQTESNDAQFRERLTGEEVWSELDKLPLSGSSKGGMGGFDRAKNRGVRMFGSPV